MINIHKQAIIKCLISGETFWFDDDSVTKIKVIWDATQAKYLTKVYVNGELKVYISNRMHTDFIYDRYLTNNFEKYIKDIGINQLQTCVVYAVGV